METRYRRRRIHRVAIHWLVRLTAAGLRPDKLPITKALKDSVQFHVVQTMRVVAIHVETVALIAKTAPTHSPLKEKVEEKQLSISEIGQASSLGCVLHSIVGVLTQ